MLHYLFRSLDLDNIFCIITLQQLVKNLSIKIVYYNNHSIDILKIY